MGLEENSIDVMINSIAGSTLKQYQSCLKLWTEFAANNKIDILKASIPEIISFLTKRFEEGASYSTLNTTRAAIALISQSDMSAGGLISRFLKGVYRQRPSRPRYSSTWDVSPVLEYLEKLHPLSALKHKEAAEKVTLLLALTTAHRLQTLALINIENIKSTNTGITIKIPDLIKTSKPGSDQPEFMLPFFKNKPSICAASVILEYIEYTKNLRDTNNKTLLIATVKPHGPASAQTLGHWIKSILGKAGVDTDQFSAYSTRHAAVSMAYKNGISVETIRRTAGWSKNSQTFAKFYNRPVQETEMFAHAVLNK